MDSSTPSIRGIDPKVVLTPGVVGFDTETHLIQPGLLTPPLVCGSFAGHDAEALLLAHAALGAFENLLADPNAVIAGANIAYDFCVMIAHKARLGEDPTDMIRAIFAACAEGRVHDVLIAEALHGIANGHLFRDPRSGGKLADPSTGTQTGRYSLAVVTDLVLGRTDAKANDYWRLRYALLENLPILEWPEGARKYPIDDAVNTREVALVQRTREGSNLHNMPAQVGAAFALQLGACWGIRVNPERVAALAAEVGITHARDVIRFRAAGFVKADGKEDGSAVKRALALAYGADPTSVCPECRGTGKRASAKTGKPVGCSPRNFQGTTCDGTGLEIPPSVQRTPADGICADRGVKMESGDEELIAYGENESEKIRDTYLPFIQTGIDAPINLSPNVLVESGRVSYNGLIQLIPRSGGVRECFQARPGYLFCSSDYSAGELCTLAQVCLWTVGHSAMADIINATKDPGALHTALAAKMIGTTTEDLAARIKAKDPQAKGFRQAAKAANFGFPGGMGAAKLVLSKRKKSEGTTLARDGTEYPGIRFCILINDAISCGSQKVTEWKGRECAPVCKECVEVAEFTLRAAWFDRFPEMREYFAWVNVQVDAGGLFECFVSERIRGGCEFTNGANNGFQALMADAAKNALVKVATECYTDPMSNAFGARPIFFSHDEIFAELPEATAHESATRISELMVSAAREFVPDVYMHAEPALMRNWSKSAEPKYNAEGRLIPWD